MPWSCGQLCSTVAWYVFDYTTPKIVTIRSFKVGLINRLVQLTIIAYVIGYVIVYKKGYQDTDYAKSTVTTKVKGIGSTLNRTDLPDVYRKVWDTADYVIPPQESNAFFVMTNAIITPGQKEGVCPEDPKVSGAVCDSGRNCTEGKALPNGNGIETGHCVLSGDNVTRTCELYAWCPVENDTLLRNIIDKINNSSYLKQCHYNVRRDPYCPVFQLGYIVRNGNADFRSLAIEGGVMSIIIKWDCDLDYGLQYCLPEYEFNRLDNEKAQIAPGWNFRFSKEYRDSKNQSVRDLYKAYGILFVFSVQGKAGKFNPVPLFINIGSGLALLGLATVMCDIVLLYVLKKRKYYQNKKYLSVVDEDFAKLAKHDDDTPVLITTDNDSSESECRRRPENASSQEYI